MSNNYISKRPSCQSPLPTDLLYTNLIYAQFSHRKTTIQIRAFSSLKVNERKSAKKTAQNISMNFALFTIIGEENIDLA